MEVEGVTEVLNRLGGSREATGGYRRERWRGCLRAVCPSLVMFGFTQVQLIEETISYTKAKRNLNETPFK